MTPERIYAVHGPGDRTVYVTKIVGGDEVAFGIEVYRKRDNGELIEYQSMLSETTLYMLMVALSGVERDNHLLRNKVEIGYSAFSYDEAVAAGLYGKKPDEAPE